MEKLTISNNTTIYHYNYNYRYNTTIHHDNSLSFHGSTSDEQDAVKHYSNKSSAVFALCVLEHDQIIQASHTLLSQLSNSLDISCMLLCFKTLPSAKFFAEEIHRLQQHINDSSPHVKTGPFIIASHSVLCNISYAALINYRLPALNAIVFFAPLFNKQAITALTHNQTNTDCAYLENNKGQPIPDFSPLAFKRLQINYSAWLGEFEPYTSTHKLITFFTRCTSPTIDHLVGIVAGATHTTVMQHAGPELIKWLANSANIPRFKPAENKLAATETGK